MPITSSPFGKKQDGKEVTLYTLSSSALEVGIIDYGAIITTIKCPDKNGEVDDIVAGFTDVSGYEIYPKYFGATVGRVCNRIANGKFTLNGTEFSLPINNPPNSLHGGIVGFDKKMWVADIEEENTINFHLESGDNEEGYPGNLKVCATFQLKESELKIRFTAQTDKDTVVNLTNHSYFNLSGHKDWKEIYGHQIKIDSDHVLPVDSYSIPTGEKKNVEGTVFDLRKPQFLTKERLDSVPGGGPGGYDHNFCLSTDGKRRIAARVEHARSGCVMTVETTQPGIQFYTGNFLDRIPGKQAVEYGKQSCFCLETQNWPDAINKIDIFPNPILRRGEKYDHSTWYTFSHS